MADKGKDAPATGTDAPATRLQRFRFRVVAPDGRELLSDIAQVHFPVEPIAGFRVTSIFVSATAANQGAIKGESSQPGKEHQIAALALDYVLTSPRDVATGQATGKRLHSPLSIVKEWGAATPQLFHALFRNETLKTVEIDCYGVDLQGKEGLVHKVKLTNALVTSIRQVTRGLRGLSGVRDLETVAFSFGQIEHLSPKDAVLASDSLNADT